MPSGHDEPDPSVWVPKKQQGGKYVLRLFPFISVYFPFISFWEKIPFIPVYSRLFPVYFGKFWKIWTKKCSTGAVSAHFRLSFGKNFYNYEYSLAPRIMAFLRIFGKFFNFLGIFWQYFEFLSLNSLKLVEMCVNVH